MKLPQTASGQQPLLLTVAICSRNRAGLLEKAVRSAAPQCLERPQEAELLVVDNASTDTTPQVLARLAKEYAGTRVHREEALGLSVARNAALRLARGAFVAFLDDDAVAKPGWLDAYLDFFKSRETARIAVVGGPVEPVYEAEPPPWYSGHKNALDRGPERRRLDGISGPWGCNIVYQRELALKAGAFDVTLGRKGMGMAAHEDTELNERLERMGYELWWEPSAGILHLTAASRLTLKWDLRSQFSEGKSVVLKRLRRRGSSAERFLYAAIRLITSPIHCLVNLIMAVLTAPFAHQRLAVAHLRKVFRNAGLWVGMFHSLRQDRV